jgi:hypothetical protein
MCDCLNGEKLIQYNKLKTGGNDPSISKAMRYATYVRTTKSASLIMKPNK